MPPPPRRTTRQGATPTPDPLTPEKQSPVGQAALLGGYTGDKQGCLPYEADGRKLRAWMKGRRKRALDQDKPTGKAYNQRGPAAQGAHRASVLPTRPPRKTPPV